MITDDAGQVDTERRAINGAERNAMRCIRVERSVARVAIGIERIDAGVANRVRLPARIGHTEFVGAGEDVAARFRVRVETLRFEVRSETRVESDVEAVVLRVSFAVPEAEV